MVTERNPVILATLPAVLGLSEQDILYTGLSLTHANAQVVSLGMATAVYAEPPQDDDADNPVRKILSVGMPAADFS